MTEGRGVKHTQRRGMIVTLNKTVKMVVWRETHKGRWLSGLSLSPVRPGSSSGRFCRSGIGLGCLIRNGWDCCCTIYLYIFVPGTKILSDLMVALESLREYIEVSLLSWNSFSPMKGRSPIVFCTSLRRPDNWSQDAYLITIAVAREHKAVSAVLGHSVKKSWLGADPQKWRLGTATSCPVTNN